MVNLHLKFFMKYRLDNFIASTGYLVAAVHGLDDVVPAQDPVPDVEPGQATPEGLQGREF
jgi:hypothetical protein